MNNLFLKNIIKYFIFRRTKLYKKTIVSIKNDSFNEHILSDVLNNAIKHVPYYTNLYSDICTNIQYTDLNILRKTDIICRETEFISRKYNQKLLDRTSTGGTTGVSINIYSPISAAIIETAFTDFAYELVAPLKTLKMGILRGYKPKKGLFEKVFDSHVLSSYDINTNTIYDYIKYIERNSINCLFVYPTAITIFCKTILMLKNKINAPLLKGIISSSEILSRESKILIMNVFPNVRLIDVYGQNEHVAFAISINNDFYHFIKQYGYTEFVDTGIKSGNQNKIVEIVSTGYSNKAMPFIKYATSDYVELDKNNNVVSIIGRTQDFLLNKEKELVPCIVLTRSHTLENVINFQYYQDTIGEVTFRVIVNKKFSAVDIQNIIQDIEKTFSGKIKGKVEIVKNIEKTKAGKQRRLIQKINI